MRPIVDGIRDEYEGRAEVQYLNARDGDTGEQSFNALSLAGHPSIVIFAPDGSESYRSVGVVTQAQLTQALNAALNASTGG